MLRISITVIAMLFTYSAVATWWIWKEPQRVTKAEQAALQAYSGMQHSTYDEGEQARENIRVVFAPLKEPLRVGFGGCHDFDLRVQDALEKATAAANIAGRLPSTLDESSSPASSKKRDGVAGERPAVGGRNP